jgi:hypothetical protein
MAGRQSMQTLTGSLSMLDNHNDNYYRYRTCRGARRVWVPSQLKAFQYNNVAVHCMLHVKDRAHSVPEVVTALHVPLLVSSIG